MGKIETTKKSVMSSYTCISIMYNLFVVSPDIRLSFGYCELETLLKYESPVAFTCSKNYGWRADVYVFGDVAIVTGYAPFGTRISYDVVQKYEKASYAIHSKEDMRKLIDTFIKEALETMEAE